jgi:hypothetical protein
MFNDAPGFFNSVNLTIPENSTWELKDGRQMPHLCQLAFDFQHIGKENPTMTSKHYDNISDSFSFEEKGQDKTKPKRKKLIGALRRAAKKASERRRKKRENLDELSFGEAFKKKRAELGPNKTFTWRGKQYNTNREDD